MHSEINWPAIMPEVALRLLGEPSGRLKKNRELRYGTRGSLSINVPEGTWFDHEINAGGGVLDLIVRKRGGDHQTAMEWLEREGIMQGNGAADGANGAYQTTTGAIAATYDYTDGSGDPLFQVVRYTNPKKFRQRRPDGHGDWEWNVRGVQRVLYRLPDLIEAIAKDQPVFITEGEKDADNLSKFRFVATTNPGGANKWQPEFNETLRGADVVLLPHNDDAGRKHMQNVAAQLQGIARRVRVLDIAKHWPACPDKGDISDWLTDGGGTAETLWTLVGTAPDWQPGDDGDGEDARLGLEIIPGDLTKTASELRDAFAKDGRFFEPLNANRVVYEAHKIRRPFRINKDGEPCLATLPERVALMYLAMRGERNLPVLKGISAAPLLQQGGTINSIAGYDPATGMWCANVPDFTLPAKPTYKQARAALLKLRTAIRTFPFADAKRLTDPGLGVEVVDLDVDPGADESGALVSLLTAVCSPSLSLAPGCLLRAAKHSGSGSGKGLLVRAMCMIAFGTQPSATTAGNNRDELDKRLATLLIQAAPAIFLDNVNGQTIKSDTLASALTEDPAQMRPLGSSTLAAINSRTFVAITGNGLALSEDLVRRFIVSDLDARMEDPETREFKSGFLQDVERDRRDLLAAALTIWRWGQQGRVGAPLKPKPAALGSYETWCEWVRNPLYWLGCQDPAARISEIKAADPRRREVAEIYEAWNTAHGATPMKVSDLHSDVTTIINPQGRARQWLANAVAELKGTRAAGYVLTAQQGAGRKAVTTYQLVSTDRETNSDG
jgi:hypothetical protein